MLALSDVAVLQHAIEHPVAPLDRAVVMARRIIVVGRLGKRPEKGALGDVEISQRLAEIVERRRRHAIGTGAEKDLVEIELEDLVLGKGPFDAPRQQRFLELALDGAVAGQQEVLGHLLGDGGGADQTPVATASNRQDVLRHGPRQRPPVEAAVLVEILVLGRNERFDQLLGDRVDGHEQAPLGGKFGQQRAIGGMHPRHDGRCVLGKLGVVGQIARRFPDEVAGSHSHAAKHGKARRKQQSQQPHHDPGPVLHRSPGKSR